MIRQRRPAKSEFEAQSPYKAATAAATAAAAAEPTLPTPAPRQGRVQPAAKMKSTDAESRRVPSPSASPSLSHERRPLLQDANEEADDSSPDDKMGWVRQNKWIVLAIASGACAAFNGVFAKLTTTELTTSFAQGVARVLHLDFAENVIEYVVRAMFFGLNLIFNGIMWTLFTQALAKGHSTTQVSIMNTSANFVITAVLGLMIFSESLPPLWWAGAALLVAGNVIIGSKDESGKDGIADEDNRERVVAPAPGLDGLGDYEDVPQIDGILDPDELKDDEDEDVVELGELRD